MSLIILPKIYYSLLFAFGYILPINTMMLKTERKEKYTVFVFFVGGFMFGMHSVRFANIVDTSVKVLSGFYAMMRGITSMITLHMNISSPTPAGPISSKNEAHFSKSTNLFFYRHASSSSMPQCLLVRLGARVCVCTRTIALIK